MRIGARFPNSGDVPSQLGLSAAAERLESAGFDSLWTSDHLAMPVRHHSTYPYSGDGRVPWAPDMDWSDSLVALGIAAAVTTRIELGTAILVAPLRSPLVVAKQMATVSVEASGRCVLGVGAGWLAEEFEAVGVPFAGRGNRLDAWIEIVREVWSGSLSVRGADHPYSNPNEMICRPLPVAPVPILVGGLSPAALRRAGRIGDGWLGLQSVGDLDPGSLAQPIASIRDHARNAGRDPSSVRITLQITESAGHVDAIVDRMEDLIGVGVHEIIVDPGWKNSDQPSRTYKILRSASPRRSGA